MSLDNWDLLEYLLRIFPIDIDITYTRLLFGSGRRDQRERFIECDISRWDKAKVNSINRWKCHDRFTTSSTRFAIRDRRRGRWTPVEVESLGNVRATGGKATVVLQSRFYFSLSPTFRKYMSILRILSLSLIFIYNFNLFSKIVFPIITFVLIA